MLTDVDEVILGLDIPLALSYGRRISPNGFGRVGGTDTFFGGRISVSVNLTNECVVPSRSRYATNVPSVPGVAVKVADAIDELVAGSGAPQEADAVISSPLLSPAGFIT